MSGEIFFIKIAMYARSNDYICRYDPIKRKKEQNIERKATFHSIEKTSWVS